jgi:hypothetical protein
MTFMYRSDLFAIAVSLLAMWIVLLYVLAEVRAIAHDGAIFAVTAAAALLVGISSSSALGAVWVHLRKHGESLYREDCDNAGIR